MKLLTKPITQRLAKNGQINAERMAEDGDVIDFFPVVKLFQPDGAGTWLLTETDPDDPDIAFGLCDLGFGSPELGSVRISELQAARGCFGLPIERDRFFKAQFCIGTYADQARLAGRIVA